jgi:hypothetical protein
MNTSTETAIFDISADIKPAEERKQLRVELAEAKAAIKEWNNEITKINTRLSELKGKR